MRETDSFEQVGTGMDALTKLRRNSSWLFDYFVSRFILAGAASIYLGAWAVVVLFIMTPFAIVPYFYVGFADPTGWIVGEKSWRTLDSGRTWELVDYGANYWDEFPPSPAMGWVSLSSEGALYDSFGRFRYRTSFPRRFFESGRLHQENKDGFALYQDMWPAVGPISEQAVYKVYVRDVELGLIYTRDSKVYRFSPSTGDAERTTLATRPHAVAFHGESDVYAAAFRRLWRSRDQGLTWELLKEFPHFPIALYAWNERLWVLGERGLCGFFELRTGEFRNIELPTPRVGVLQQPASLVGMAASNEAALIVDSSSFGYVFRLGADGLPREIEKVRIAEVPIYSVAVTDAGVAYAVGGRWPNILGLGGSADIFVSEDFRTWRRLDLQ